MGRFIVYGLIIVLGVFALTCTFILRTRGGHSDAAMLVSVHDLSTAPQAHAQTRVTTRGVLRLLGDPQEHYLVTSDGLGVAVRGYDREALRALVEQEVTVTGRFGFDQANGTYIEADSVIPVQ